MPQGLPAAAQSGVAENGSAKLLPPKVKSSQVVKPALLPPCNFFFPITENFGNRFAKLEIAVILTAYRLLFDLEEDLVTEARVDFRIAVSDFFRFISRMYFRLLSRRC